MPGMIAFLRNSCLSSVGSETFTESSVSSVIGVSSVFARSYLHLIICVFGVQLVVCIIIILYLFSLFVGRSWVELR